MEHRKSSGVAKAGLATGITGAALGTLGVLNNGGGNGLLGALFGAPRGDVVAFQGGPVTEKELCLVRENIDTVSAKNQALAEKDAIIAEYKAKEYTNEAIKELTRLEVNPLKDRVCSLETAAAVNAARDQDFRRYVEREFVHQPTASMNESIITCKPRNCCCDDHHC